MAFLLFVVAAVLSVIGMATDNDTLFDVSWVAWLLGLLLALRAWRLHRKYGTPEKLMAAAESGDLPALRSVALLAKIQGDLDEAERLFRLGVDRKDPESMWEMGRLVEARDGLAASEQWFRMAAEHGHFAAKRFFRQGHALNMNGDNPL
ncbi:sel1 repeat family protein [Streptomyces sp. NBC_00102]|uniref:sel1 repeat family protein n=1 Tax=Streptomyces sp. NBC_00102 TaxID=2975652 RepID=UPI002253362D|nr:sel1 repeat family protein [Streptomyces sp. NBC_00102]MCX5398897.1 sel1 repeat family protein [Streptomyces sp. NBC_00102]